ncbi:MAG: Plus agglutinin, partial [bacterium]
MALPLLGKVALTFKVDGKLFCHLFYVNDNFPVEALLGSEFLNPHACSISYASNSRLSLGQPTCPTCVSHFAAYGRTRPGDSPSLGGIPLVPPRLTAPILYGDFRHPSPPRPRVALPLVPQHPAPPAQDLRPSGVVWPSEDPPGVVRIGGPRGIPIVGMPQFPVSYLPQLAMAASVAPAPVPTRPAAPAWNFWPHGVPPELKNSPYILRLGAPSPVRCPPQPTTPAPPSPRSSTPVYSIRTQSPLSMPPVACSVPAYPVRLTHSSPSPSRLGEDPLEDFQLPPDVVAAMEADKVTPYPRVIPRPPNYPYRKVPSPPSSSRSLGIIRRPG